MLYLTNDKGKTNLKTYIMNIIKVELDTVVETKNGLIVSDSESEFFVEMLYANNIKYKIIDENGPAGGAPIIEYVGTFEQLLPLFEMMCPMSHPIEELRVLLKDWNGDTESDVWMEVMC